VNLQRRRKEKEVSKKKKRKKKKPMENTHLSPGEMAVHLK
jgi:hypothetical protein